MQHLSTPVETLSRCIYSAVFADAPDIEMPVRAIPNVREASIRLRRPEPAECVVRAMYPTLWGSTAMGFGGLGGAAMTEAYTVVLEVVRNHVWLAYYDGHYAFKVDAQHSTPAQLAKWRKDIAAQMIGDIRSSVESYGAIPRKVASAD